MVVGGTTLAGVAAASGAATGETEDSPQPEDSDSYEYPVMGADSDAPVATVFGGFNCPYTEDMVSSSFAEIIEEFVEPGRLNLVYEPLEYDYDGNPWVSENGVMAGQAGMGVWEEDPDSFWNFFAELWKHMPGQVDEDKLEQIMNDAGVSNASYIADNLENWDPELQEASSDAESEGVDYTPTIELKGDLGNRDNVVDWIEQRLDGDGSSSSSSSDDSSEDSSQQESSTEEDSGSDDGGDDKVCSDDSDTSNSESSDSEDTSTSETTSSQDTSSSGTQDESAKTCS